MAEGFGITHQTLPPVPRHPVNLILAATTAINPSTPLHPHPPHSAEVRCRGLPLRSDDSDVPSDAWQVGTNVVPATQHSSIASHITPFTTPTQPQLEHKHGTRI